MLRLRFGAPLPPAQVAELEERRAKSIAEVQRSAVFTELDADAQELLLREIGDAYQRKLDAARR